MTERSHGKMIPAAAMAGLMLGLACLTARAQGPMPPEDLTGKTAAQAYKNIQVLKDIPSDQLIPSMQFITASLGVGCDFCHVEHHFDADDKEPKKTARKMMTMMFAINKDDFNDRPVVSCYSCHHGEHEPIAIPILAESMAPPAEAENSGAPKLAALPAANALLEKWLQAVGGAEALQKISTRVEKGTVTAFGGHEFPIEVYAKAPDMRMSVMHMPRGESTTAFDGHAGWLGFGGMPPRPMMGPDLQAAALDADFYFPVHIRQLYLQFRTRPPEKVGDQEYYVVSAFKRGMPPLKLYFDEQSGLLVRLVRYAVTPLGSLPTQIDYADYRDEDGVKVPFKWTLARPEGRFTIQVADIQQNVPIDNSKFAMPAMPAAPQAKPPAP